MKKIIQILKDNPAYLALMKGKGEIVVSHASDEAILIASAFFSSERPMLIVREFIPSSIVISGTISYSKKQSCFFSM